MLCPGFLYLLQPWSLPGKSLGTKMASMLESTALWRKEDLRLGYVWIGVGIFARPCIGPCEKKKLKQSSYSTKYQTFTCPLQNLVTEWTLGWLSIQRGVAKLYPSTWPISARGLLGLYSSCMSHLFDTSLLSMWHLGHGMLLVERLRFTFTSNANLYHVTKFPLYLSFTVHYFYS